MFVRYVRELNHRSGKYVQETQLSKAHLKLTHKTMKRTNTDVEADAIDNLVPCGLSINY